MPEFDYLGDDSGYDYAAEEERKRREAEQQGQQQFQDNLNNINPSQQQTGGVGDGYTWQNDVQAMQYNPANDPNYNPFMSGDNASQYNTQNNYQPFGGGVMAQPNGGLPYDQRMIDAAGYGNTGYDNASSFAYGDYNYNPGVFAYNPPSGYDGKVTGRDSFGYGDYNYNPPTWEQQPSNYNEQYPGANSFYGPRGTGVNNGRFTEGGYMGAGETQEPAKRAQPRTVGMGMTNQGAGTNQRPPAAGGNRGYGSGNGGYGGYSPRASYGDGGDPSAWRKGLLNWRF